MGTTAGAGDDCGLRAGDDITVMVNIPTDGNWSFGLCSSSTIWDTYMYLGSDCCTEEWSDDDGCGNVLSRIRVEGLTAGDYFVDIEPFSAGYTGPVTLDVSTFEPGGRSVAPDVFAPHGLERVKPGLGRR